MPPVGKLAGLTAEEKLDFQRERNRRKSAALRARKKEASKGKTELEEGGSSSSLFPCGADAPPKEKQLQAREAEKDNIIRRLVARLEELGEGQEEIERLVEGDWGRRRSILHGCLLAGASPPLPKIETTAPVWIIDQDPFPGPAFELPYAARTSRAGASSSPTLFGSLMNDSTSLPSSAPQAGAHLPQISHLSFPSLDVDKIRLALNVSAAYPHVPAQYLPTYSYSSFASSLATYPSWIRTADDTLEWKWRLFEFHRVSHENRHHPTEGYLSNPQLDALVASAQLLILKLVASTSTLNRKAVFDARRPLQNQADRDYLERDCIDPRIHYIPGPRARLRTSQLTSGGPPNFMHLTEQIGQGFEISIIHGDFWDLTSWSGPDYSPLPLSTSEYLSCIDAERIEGFPRGRGALIREIVLGLEKPGWRVPPPPAYVPSPFEQACIQEEPPIWTHWERDHRIRTMTV